MLAQLAEALAAGQVRTLVAQVIPLEDAARAHRLAKQGGLHGKVALRA
jgi:NADPH:quinone reductase-like Zn-dependent oxidoreductase